jgi:hypothetical protein
MRPQRRRIVGSIVVLAALAGRVAFAAPLFTLDDDGKTFLYRARPGEGPAAVADMFGIPTQELPRFLRDNNIADATRVGSNFAYRIPNAPARALSDRLTGVETENAKLTAAANEASAQAQALGRDAADARRTASDAEARAKHAARIESLWPLLQAALVLLVLGIAGAIAVAVAAVGRQRRAERFSKALALELEEKRKSALAERQESARRILDLEARARALEAQIGPRLLVGGRS